MHPIRILVVGYLPISLHTQNKIIKYLINTYTVFSLPRHCDILCRQKWPFKQNFSTRVNASWPTRQCEEVTGKKINKNGDPLHKYKEHKEDSKTIRKK